MGDSSVDIVICNCVLNLSSDKAQVFREAYRVLKPGGKMYVSDMVLTDALSEAQKNDEELLACCVGSAIPRDDYIEVAERAGFKMKVLSEDADISKRQYLEAPVASLMVQLDKP